MTLDNLIAPWNIPKINVNLYETWSAFAYLRFCNSKHLKTLQQQKMYNTFTLHPNTPVVNYIATILLH